MFYRFLKVGKINDISRTFAKLVIADRLLEAKFGKRIELVSQLEPNDFNGRLN